MNFPEFIRANASWLDRLCCVFFGHALGGNYQWHPMDEAEDRHRLPTRFCSRCGAQP